MSLESDTLLDLVSDLEMAREIIADKVRGTARGFWEKMGFSDMGNGNYRWVKYSVPQSHKISTCIASHHKI